MEMTELEQLLAAPGGQAVRDDRMARLVELEQRLRRQLAASVPRADFKALAACAEAAGVAQELLRIWPVGAPQQAAGPVEKQQTPGGGT
jgi:hypothetical protein